MAKGLPYFKFFPTEWITGNIFYETLEVQGLFINICAIYWQRDGKLTIDDINLRFNKPTALISLTDRYFSLLDGFIIINFLNEQLHERSHLSMVNSNNGSKGGRPKAVDSIEEKTDRLTTAKRNESEIKPIRRRIRIRIKEEDMYSLLNCENIFIEKTKTLWPVPFAKKEADKFYNFYSSKNWMVGKNKMKSLNHAIAGWISRQEVPEPEKVETGEEMMLRKFRERGF